nr:DUF2934 domain-containing protein [Sinorhizobium medicae]
MPASSFFAGKPDDEELIRNRAYELWERAGRPQGDGLKYWFQAAEEVQSTFNRVGVLENAAVLGETDEAGGIGDAKRTPKPRGRGQPDSAAPLKRRSKSSGEKKGKPTEGR